MKVEEEILRLRRSVNKLKQELNKVQDAVYRNQKDVSDMSFEFGTELDNIQKRLESMENQEESPS